MQQPSVEFVACSMLKRTRLAASGMQLALQMLLDKYCDALYACQSGRCAGVF